MNDSKISLLELSRFLILYYTKAFPYQKLGQAFVNRYHQCRENMQQAAYLHKIKNDKIALEFIVENYIQDEV